MIQQYFTLIELLIEIVIIAILMATLLPIAVTYPDKPRWTSLLTGPNPADPANSRQRRLPHLQGKYARVKVHKAANPLTFHAFSTFCKNMDDYFFPRYGFKVCIRGRGMYRNGLRKI